MFENKFKKAKDPNVLQESCEENCQNVSRKCVQEYEKTSKPKTLAGSLAPAIMQGSREGRYELALAVERRDTCGGLWFLILWLAQRPEAAGGSARDEAGGPSRVPIFFWKPLFENVYIIIQNI